MELIAIIVLALFLLPVVLLTSGIIRIVLGVLFCLFLPGYALVAVLFTRSKTISALERFGLSIGISIAAVALIGLGLNYTPFGITVESTLFSVAGFTVIMAGLALYRRRRLQPDERFEVNLETVRALGAALKGRNRLDRVLNITLAVVILGVIATLSFTALSPKTGERFTEFGVLGSEGQMAGYPRQLALGQEAALTVMITNREGEPVSYHLTIRIGGRLLNEIGPIDLEAEESWQKQVYFTPVQPGPDQKVELLLFRGEDSTPYRSLHIWINVNEN